MTRRSLLAATCCLALIACGERDGNQEANIDAKVSPPIDLVDKDGERVGSIELSEDGNGTTISLTATGLSEGLHGVHLHETGLCEGPDFQSAGGHWNPEGRQHGRDNPGGAHVGDLANLGANGEGQATSTYLVPGVLMQGTKASLSDVDGTALIIHEGPDDYVTDPSGDSGARVACAVLASSR